MYCKFERVIKTQKKKKKTLTEEHLRRWSEAKQDLFQDFADSGGEDYDGLVVYEDRRNMFREKQAEEFDMIDRQDLLKRNHNDVSHVDSHIRRMIKGGNFMWHPDAPGNPHKMLYAAFKSKTLTRATIQERSQGMRVQGQAAPEAMARFTAAGGMFSMGARPMHSTFQFPQGVQATMSDEAKNKQSLEARDYGSKLSGFENSKYISDKFTNAANELEGVYKQLSVLVNTKCDSEEKYKPHWEWYDNNMKKFRDIIELAECSWKHLSKKGSGAAGKAKAKTKAKVRAEQAA